MSFPKFRRPGATAATSLTREEMLAEINGKATDQELEVLVKLFNNTTIKNMAIKKAQEFL